MIPKRKRTSPLQIFALLFVFAVSFFAGKFIADWGFVSRPEVNGTTTAQGQDEEFPVKRLNVLLLGIDARPGEKDARTDSMVLVSIDRETKKIAMVSIPRDTLVNIPGHGQGKINSANVYGGADLARETVEGLLGVQIPYYVKTNFNGFQEIVDTLGGVNIDVEKRMYYPSENINLKPGLQELDGAKALAYVRFRHDALGDIGRTERQQKFLTALAKEILTARSIIKAPVLIPKLMNVVDTNLGVSDAIFLARAVSNLESDNIVTATLPGTFYNYKGASYWKIDDDKAKVVLNDLFKGLKVATITGPDVNVPPDKPVSRKPEPGPVQETNTPPGEDNQGPDSQVPSGGDQNPGSVPDQEQKGSAPTIHDTTIPPGPGTDSGQPGQNQPSGQIPGSSNPSSQVPGSQNPTEQNGQKSGGQSGQTDGTTAPSTGPTKPGTTDPGSNPAQTGTTSSTSAQIDIISQG